jgi:sugar phosphate permease
MSVEAPPARARFHYAWIVLAITFGALLSAGAIRSMPGVLMVPLEQEFGWTRATISLAVSLNLMLYGLLGPFSAALVEYLGARRTMMGALLLIAVGVAFTALMRDSWQLIMLWGLAVGVGTGMMALALGATVVNRWFTRHRGLAIGILTASSATGQLLFLPLFALLVESFGWRLVSIAVAGFALVMIPIVALFMRNSPFEIGAARYGEARPAEAPKRPTQNPVALAVSTLLTAGRKLDFWLLFFSFFVCGLSTNGLVGTHFIPLCFDHGISEVQSASLLAMIGAFDFVGTLASGWLSDRFNNRILLFWYYGLRGLSLVFLPYAFDVSIFGLSIFAVFYGLDWVATVPPTVRLTADVFGREKSGIVFGWIFAAHQLGAATAAYGAGAIRTDVGNYLPAFIISGAFCLLTAVMVLGIGRRGPRPVPVGAE